MNVHKFLSLVKPATGFRERLFGLLNYPRLQEGEGLWLAPCRAIHTVGMRFPIDLVFVSRDGTVLRVERAVPPFRFRLCWRARSVIETSAGWAAQVDLMPGDCLGPMPVINAINAAKAPPKSGTRGDCHAF